MKPCLGGCIAAWLLVLVASGCAYTTQSTLDPKYQSVAVAPFKNTSREYGFEAALTDCVARKFVADGRLELVTADNADLLVQGAITNYSLRGFSFERHDDVTQFLCEVTAKVSLIDQKTGQVVWEETKMAGHSSYYTRALARTSDRLHGNSESFQPVVRSLGTEEENLRVSEALDQLASNIVYRTVEPWPQP